MQTQQLLRASLPLIRQYGFTRKTLSLSAQSLPTPHTLSDTAVSALFGSGDDARRTLITAWLEEGRVQMKGRDEKTMSVSDLLKKRLRWNEDVLQLLPEAFALMISPTSGIPPIDPRPALMHAMSIADQACYLSGCQSTGTEWYTKRAALAAIYTAAELHQIASPKTAETFLDDLLKYSHDTVLMLSDSSEFAQYIGRSWIGIVRSLGLR